MHVHRKSSVGVLRSTHGRFVARLLTQGSNFDSDLKSKWENYFLQICCLVYADIALDGFKWQRMDQLWLWHSSFVLSAGCGGAARSQCGWGQSPGFYGDFTCSHLIKQPLFHSVEMVQGRERRGRQGWSISKEEPEKSVLVCCSVSVREWTEAIPAGWVPGTCWAPPC